MCPKNQQIKQKINQLANLDNELEARTNVASDKQARCASLPQHRSSASGAPSSSMRHTAQVPAPSGELPRRAGLANTTIHSLSADGGSMREGVISFGDVSRQKCARDLFYGLLQVGSEQYQVLLDRILRGTEYF